MDPPPPPPPHPPPFPGSMINLSKCGELAMDEKRKLVHELAKWPDNASEVLQSWTRKDILEILCAEMGKERKYTGLSKQKLVELLLRIVMEKTSQKQAEKIDHTSNQPSKPLPSSKRQRKADNPSRLPIETNIPPTNNVDINDNPRYCRNVACKATLSPDDVFCKRCSCCICHRYDDNKDPSLWLFCSTDNSSGGDPCGMSCHLECALKNEKTGLAEGRCSTRPDGSFYCASCGKVNDLLGCLRKQLIMAKDARRVDILCHRISLSHKLLEGTEKYKKLLEFVGTAMEKLETEVGPINGLATGMARGIVNRLSAGTEIHKLILLAVDSLDSILNDNATQSPPEPKTQGPDSVSSTVIRFEDISSTSLAVVLGSEDCLQVPEEVSGFTIWQRKADSADYPAEPTCKLVGKNRRFLSSDLFPATKYVLKVVALNDDKELGTWEAEVTTSSIREDVPMDMPTQGEPVAPPSPKTNSSDLSNRSEGDESNSTGIYHDLNKLPREFHAYQDKPQPANLEKFTNHKETCRSQDTCTAVIANRMEAAAPEETPGHSVSALDEEPNSVMQTDVHTDPTSQADQSQASDTHKSEDMGLPLGNDMSVVPYCNSKTVLPVTPSKLEASKEGTRRTSKLRSSSSGPESWLWKPAKELKMGNSLKKRSAGNDLEEMGNAGALEGDYEYCVKVVRWLECKGHIETNFRVKFLTWFSLRATVQERKVVSVFVDTLIDDPPSLAGQLVDAFSEGINRKRHPEAPAHGFCMRLWH